MKCKLNLAVLGVLLAATALGQPALNYQNDGLVTNAPVIDAINFINNGTFLINILNNETEGPDLETTEAPPTPFETQNTLNYTNLASAVMKFNSGFHFDLFDSTQVRRRPAASFFNDGNISIATLDTVTTLLAVGQAAFGAPLSNFIVFNVSTAPATITATNIVNRGDINVGLSAVLKMTGETVDVHQSSIISEGAGDVINIGFTNFAFFFNNGVFNDYWGIGDPVSQRPLFYPNGISPTAFFGTQPYQTPFVDVTTRNGGVVQVALGGPTFQAYLSDVTDVSTSNRWVRAIYTSNTNTDMKVNVYLTQPFPLVGPLTPVVVEWTNLLGNSVNNLYLYDDFGIDTNFTILPDIAHGFPVTGVPWNYSAVAAFGAPISFFRAPFSSNIVFFGTLQTPIIIPPGTFNPSGGLNNNVTNQWAAYQATLLPTSVSLDGSGYVDITNVPGRVELRSDFLDLSQSQITSENYVLLSATNQFIGSAGATVASPWEDLNLRNTNGFLLISNTISSLIIRPEGIISLFSARWTNITTNNPGLPGVAITNRYHVLFVDSKIAPTAPVRTESLTLSTTNLSGGDSDNLIISDVFSVTRNLLLDSQRLTITTNDPLSAAIPNGALNILSPGIVWPNVTPRLQYFTNDGLHTALNAVFFGGQRTSPFFETTVFDPYQAFVNSGRITNFSSQIQANYFQDSGVVAATGGGISLQSQVSVLTNGAFLATGGVVAGSSNLLGTGGSIVSFGGPISITANSLFVSNHVLQAGGTLTLSAPNIDDGSLAFNSADFVTNQNFWVASGINDLIPPTLGSLLATTITNFAGPQKNVVNKWAGADLGAVSEGFSNNAALGHLVLLGATNSVFTFSAAVGNNALYVDLLDLRGATTRQNLTGGNGRFLGLATTPGMKVYFGGAIADGLPVSLKLAQATPGFIWVTNFDCGFFSSTNVIVSGVSNRINYARYVEPTMQPPVFNPVNCDVPSGLALDLNPPVILSQPQSQNVSLNSSVQLKVLATGNPAPKYQWQHEGTNIAATGSALTFDSVTAADAGAYRVLVKNNGNAIASATAFLVINVPPAITAQPQSQYVQAGSKATFTVAATGIPAPAYQWRFNGANIPGATRSSYTRSNVLAAVTGSYTVVCSNIVGSCTSSVATLAFFGTTNLKLSFPGGVAGGGGSGGFTPTRATYVGLFSDVTNGATSANSGYITVTTTESGKLSGRMLLAGKSLSLSGSLSDSGKAVIKVARGDLRALTVTLQVDLATGDQIMGKVTDGRWTADLWADRAVFGSANPAPMAGNYTMKLDTGSTNATGKGCGTVKVSASGAVQWSATLSDGTKVVQKSAVSGQGYWPLYASLYGGRGVVLSWVHIASDGLGGQVVWLKSPGAPLKYYPRGFTNGLEVAGSAWSKTGSGPALNWPDGKGELLLEGGGLASSLTIPLQFSSNNRVTSSGQKLNLSINGTTGLFRGSVSQGGKPVQFQGILLQGDNKGYGFFLGSGQSGQVLLEPRP